MATKAKVKRTEHEMLGLLRQHLLVDGGNGPANAMLTGVRNDAGFSATRTIDAMSMSLWPSRGLRLSAYEIKCSRSDWLTELRNPAKAEAFVPYVDHFVLVVADKDFVKPGELPESWGLMCPHGKGLTTVVPPKLLEGTVDPPRGLLAAMLRCAGVAERSKPEIDAARQQAFQEGIAFEKETKTRTRDYEVTRLTAELERLKVLEELIPQDMLPQLRGNPERFAAGVRMALKGQRDLDHMRSRMERLGTDAKVLSEQVDRILGEHEITVPERGF